MSEHKVSQHILDKKRQNRRQIIWSVALAVMIVLGMTYYDLKIRDYTKQQAVVKIAYHYVSSDDDVVHLPDDYTSLTIWQGTLTPQPDGSVSIEGAAVTPVTFPQRQVDLSLGLAALPASAEPALVKAIGDAFKKWEAKNSLVMDATLDTSALDDVAVTTLDDLISKLHYEYSEQYRYTLAFDPLDQNDMLVKADKDALANLMKKIIGLTIRVTADNASDAIAAADTLGYRFSVIVPAGSDLDTFANEAAAKAKHFTHFIRDVTPPPAP